MAGFFPEETQETQVDPLNTECAEMLRKAVGGMMSVKTTAEQFRLLRKMEGASMEEIKESITWLWLNKKKPYTPVIRSGKSFRYKYSQLRQAMLRDGTIKEATPQVEITPEAMKIVERLQSLNWQGETDNLPAAVQLSLTNYQQFCSTLKQLFTKLDNESIPCENTHKREQALRFINRITQYLPGASHFIQYWFTDLNDWMSYAKTPNLNLLKYVFDPDSKRFQKWGRMQAESYCGESKRWALLMELMKL